MKSKWVYGFGTILVCGLIFWGVNSKKIHRNISSNEPSKKVDVLTTSMEELDEVKRINSLIVAITSKDEINAKIDEVQAISAKHPDWNIIKLYSLILNPIKKLEGFIWRLRPVVEDCGVCHIYALSFIKDLYYSDYLGGPHTKAVLNYFVEPTNNQEQFEKISTFQDFMLNQLSPDLMASLESLKSVIENTKPGYFFDLDGHLISGYSNEKGKEFRFISEKNRSKKIVRGNLHYLSAGFNQALGTIYLSVNYNVDSITKFANSMIRGTALNNFRRTLPRHVTPKELLKTVNKAKFRSLGTARLDKYSKEQIQENLDSSFNYFKQSLSSRILAFQQSRDEADMQMSSDYLISPKLLDLNYDDAMAKLKEKIRIYKNASKNESSVITSQATGHMFKVNPRAIFLYREDLKKFLPEKMYKETKRKSKIKLANGEKTVFWNYKYGMPIKWQDPTFGGLLPDASNSNLFEILRSMRLTPATRTFASFLPIP